MILQPPAGKLPQYGTSFWLLVDFKHGPRTRSWSCAVKSLIHSGCSVPNPVPSVQAWYTSHFHLLNSRPGFGCNPTTAGLCTWHADRWLHCRTDGIASECVASALGFGFFGLRSTFLTFGTLNPHLCAKKPAISSKEHVRGSLRQASWRWRRRSRQTDWHHCPALQPKTTQSSATQTIPKLRPIWSHSSMSKLSQGFWGLTAGNPSVVNVNADDLVALSSSWAPASWSCESRQNISGQRGGSKRLAFCYFLHV